MLKIVIVEDEKPSAELLQRLLKKYCEEKKITLEYEVYDSAVNFLDDNKADYDILLLDIQMPHMNGMELAQKLRKQNDNCIIIFVTNMAQYAISGYEVEALDFILKPINRYSFALKVKRAVARCRHRDEEYISIRAGGETHRVSISDVQYLDMVDHHVIYHTVNGSYSEYITLKEACRKIDRAYFVYCNRSYLVNLRHVRSVGKDTVTVGNDELLISRPQKKAFLTALSEFMRGKK